MAEAKSWLATVGIDRVCRDRDRWNLSKLASLAEKVLRGFQMMTVTLTDAQAACQVFLWLQEKALFSEAARGDEASFGCRLRAVDLARNLVLAPFLGTSIEDQERVYLDTWWL